MPRDMPLDEESIIEMQEKIFELALAEIQYHDDSVSLQDAVRAVLVTGMRVSDASEKFSVPQPNISRAVTRINQQIDLIAEREGWRYQTFLLPAGVCNIIERFEDETIKPLRQRQLEKDANKKEKRTKSAKGVKAPK
jgi:hypothetical protein